MNRLTGGRRKSKKRNIRQIDRNTINIRNSNKARILSNADNIYSKIRKQNQEKTSDLRNRRIQNNKVQRNIRKIRKRKLASRYKLRSSMNLRRLKTCVAMIMIMFLIFTFNKSDILSYFTNFKSITNVFSINAQYTVTFNSNSGTGIMPDQDISYNVSTALTTNTFTKDGYVFNGWNTLANGEGTAYTDGQYVTNLEDITLFAQWVQAVDCTVTFNFGSESFVGTNYINSGISLFNTDNINRNFEVSTTMSNFEYLAGQESSRNVFICNQYEGGNPYQGFAFQYRDNTIKIQGNSVSTNESSVAWGKTSGSITFTRTGTELYYDNNFLIDYSNIVGTFTAPLTFGANIDNSGNPRRYCKADLADMTIALKYTYSEIPNITLPTPTRTGYTFDGWYTESTGGTKITTPSVAQLGNKTIYAHWIPESPTEYYIVYSGNGGTGSMSNQTIPYGTPTPLNTNTFTKTDATFNGWNTAPDGTGTSYSDGQTVTDIGNVVLYAQWQEPTYKVTFNYGSENFVGTNHIDTGIALFNDTNIHRNFEVTTTLSNFTHISSQDRDTILSNHNETGNQFQGFSLSYREGRIKVQATNTSTDKYLQPWGQSSGNINYTRTDNKLYFNNTFIIDFSNIYAGFNTSLIFGANVNYNGAVRRYLYGDLSNMCVALYYTNAEIPYITLPTPTKTGYTFDGWYTEATGGTKVTTPTVALLAGKTIYAHWSYQATTYTIRYNANGGSGSMADQPMTYGTAANLRTNTFTRTGYTFNGWNSKADGSGIRYTNNQSVNNLSSIDGAIVDFYAQWELDSGTQVKYAVQIYGINQDVDENDVPLGLTFGPATGADYNNSYVTHEYEETSSGSGEYYVKIVTHTVAANNSETISKKYLYKDGGTTTRVTRTTAEKNKYDINMHEMTWQQIKAVSDKTAFLDCMLCGDTKSVELTLNSTIASGATFDQYGDGAGMLQETLNTYYRKWNPRPSENSYVGTGITLDEFEQIHGSNAIKAGGYSSSHIRATLVGEDSKTNKGYAGDVNLNETNSLFSCLPSELKNVITAKKVKYVTRTNENNYSINDDISDKIWLFSNRELYGKGEHSGNTAEGIGASGDGYDKFGNSESKYHLLSYSDGIDGDGNIRICHYEDGHADYWWTRSSFIENTTSVYAVYYVGLYAYSSAYEVGINFGFCIDSDPVNYSVKFNSNTGYGTMANQPMVSNVPIALTANAFTKTGYIFKGWNTDPNGNGTSYANEQVVNKLSNTEGAIVNLYAQWEKAPTKYAVQIYGINQDEGASGNTLGLTFGPATGADYNNAYVTHEYEETSSGSGEYYVKIVTHTVVANNSETTTEEYLYQNGGTTDKVIRTTAEKNKYDINMHNMTWTQIAGVNDKTAFLDCMLCGDTKSVSLTLNSTIETSNVYDQYGDGAGVLYNTIDNYYRKWNPSKNDNSYVGTGVTLDNNEQSDGSNARNTGSYSVSHIRATLVGKDSKTNEGYAGDVNLDSTNSLYTCIESDLRNVIKAKKVKYVTGTNYTSGNYSLNDDILDKIWLFSNRELYGTGVHSGIDTEGIGTSGDGYDKFGNNESKYYISSYNNNAVTSRVAYDEGDLSYGCWLRSPDLLTTYYVYDVSNTGYLGGSSNAYASFGIAFGFCIDSLQTYNITYNLNGGTVATSNPTTYNEVTNTFTLNNPTREGYTFKGWSGTGLTGTTNTTVTIPQGSTGDRSYTANWILNTYTIHFNSNGGSGSMADQAMTYGTAANLRANSFTRTGYRFSGWNTVAGGTGTSYTNSQSVNNLSSTNGAIVELYAQWQLESAPQVNYAVQIYGINEDIDENGETLGLTFGPATGANYNNAYVTHEYEETSSGSGKYYVKRITHTVATNGDETSTEAYLYSGTKQVTRTEAEKNKYNKNIHEMTWGEIAAVSDKTDFLDCMLCGDTKKVEINLNNTIGNGSAPIQYGDGAGILYCSINPYYRMWNPPNNNTDSPERNNSAVGTGITLDSNELAYGSNARNAGGYSVSHMRATLIGENSKTNIAYAGDVNLNESNSLYSCLPSDLKNVITAKKVRYVTGTSSSSYNLNDDIADKIWAFSCREMYGTGVCAGATAEGLGSDGHGYSKFATKASKYYISSYKNSSATQRSCYDESSNSATWRLRSPDLSSTYDSYVLTGSGNFSVYSPYNVLAGLSFGFCIR